jgi:hypothetical protein
LDDLARLGLHEAQNAIDEGTRGKILAGAALLLTSVLLEEAFVQVAQALLLRAEPIELIDVFDELLQVAWVLEAGLGRRRRSA